MPREWPTSDIKITGEHNETLAGHSVRVVTRARLNEISVSKEGCAGDDAFAVLVVATVTPKPMAGRAQQRSTPPKLCIRFPARRGS